MAGRVRKSRQKEAAGTADAVVMQIEWSEGEALALAGVRLEAEEGACDGMEARIAIGKRCDREHEVEIVSGAGRTGNQSIDGGSS